MKNKAGRILRLSMQPVLVGSLAALCACGGGSDEAPVAEASVQAASAATAQVAQRHANAYDRTGLVAIATSTDGKMVAVAHSDGRVSVLDAASRSEIKQLSGPSTHPAAGLIFSADGRYLVTVGRDSAAQVWSTDTGTLSLTLHGHEHPLRSIGASADGSVVATGGEETRVMVWDGKTGRLKRILTGGTDFVNSVSVSPDGSTVASGDASSRILVWDVASGHLLRTLKGHAGEVTATAFSPDGRLLASAGDDGKVALWEGAGNQPSLAFDGAVNTMGQGGPVPLGYGRLLVGSQIISVGFSTNNEILV